MREMPSRNAINIRRSYFDRQGPDRAPLGQGVEAMKGVYASIRPSQVSFHLGEFILVLTFSHLGQVDGGQC